MPTVAPKKAGFDFQSMEVEIIGQGTSFGINAGLEEIEYNVSIDRAKAWGASRNPELASEGFADYDASITMQRYWWHYLAAKSAELGVPLGVLTMRIPVVYFDKAGNTVVDTLDQVKIAGIEAAMSQGSELGMVTVPLFLMNIYFNGIDVWGNTLGDGAPIAGGSNGTAMGATDFGIVNGGFSGGSFGGGVSFP